MVRTDVISRLRARRAARVVVAPLLGAALLVGGCGGGGDNTGQTAVALSKVCAPLGAVGTTVTGLLASDAAKSDKAGTAKQIEAQATAVGKHADQLDDIAKDAKDPKQINGLLSAEIALRRIAIALGKGELRAAGVASRDFVAATKDVGAQCPSPLGDNTINKLAKLVETTPVATTSTTPVPTTP
jgi:hypothetical protein